MDDLTLVKMVKDGDSSAMKELSSRHSGIFLEIIDKQLSQDIYHVQKQDLRAEKDYHIYSAAMAYRTDSDMKFSTFLGQTAKWKCGTLKKSVKEKNTVFLADEAESIKDCAEESSEDKENIEKIFDLVDAHPDELTRKIIYARFSRQHKKKWNKISEENNISPCWARILTNKFVDEAKKELVKL